MDLRSVRRRCEEVLADVDVPRPFDVEAFRGVVATRRRRHLRLVPKQTSAGPCGVWLALPSVDLVFYEPATSALHRDHIILHELGHLLCEHGASEIVDDDVLRELLPHLDPLMVRRVLGRTTYSRVEEQEAEMLASLVLRRSLGHPDALGGDGPESRVLDELQHTLGGERGRR